MNEGEPEWARGIRDEIARAEHELTEEGRAELVLKALPSKCYHAKKEREPFVRVGEKLFRWEPEKTADDLAGVSRLVYQGLITEGFKPFIKLVDSFMGRGSSDWYICIPV